MSDVDDFHDEEVGDFAQPVDDADKQPQQQLSDALQAAVKNAVAEAARTLLPHQSRGKGRSMSRETSPSSGGAEGDIGSEDLDGDCDNHNDSGGGDGSQRSTRVRGGRPPTYLTAKEKRDARNAKAREKYHAKKTVKKGREVGSAAALPPRPPRPPPPVPRPAKKQKPAAGKSFAARTAERRRT
jgi:hypothetical protein